MSFEQRRSFSSLKFHSSSPAFTTPRSFVPKVHLLAQDVIRNRDRHLKISRNKSLSLLVCADVNWDAFKVSQGKVYEEAVLQNSSQSVYQYDFVVVGGGIAGLTYALKVANFGKVAVLAKDVIDEGATKYAQGGVCSVLHPLDSVDDHVRDTMVAGVQLNDEQVVRMVCQEGPALVLELAEMGANFTREVDGNLHLTKEGGHSHRRIVHAADMTGRAISDALVGMVHNNPNIDVFEHHFVKDLVIDEVKGQPHCFGVDALDDKEMKVLRFVCPVTMLATGGAGWVYPFTTNPHVSTGDGIAMALRANAKIANMEFVQFHPTSLYNPNQVGSSFLITEAVRGEGGLLFDVNGFRFMPEYDSRLELAPRDVVARSIQAQMQKTDAPHVWLDISHKPAEQIVSHFPTINRKCLQLGIDITKDPIPVVPAQHYLCGGIVTGMQGETDVQGLFACGESAYTGLHGANRLASNSLLEGLVFADRAAQPSVAHVEYAFKNCSRQFHYAAAVANSFADRQVKQLSGDLEKWIACKKANLRKLMWEQCGIVRCQSGLKQALSQLAGIYVEAKMVSDMYGVNKELVELLNLVTVGELIVASCLTRRESRGLHFSSDFPKSLDVEKRATITSWNSLKSKFKALNIKRDALGASLSEESEVSGLRV